MSSFVYGDIVRVRDRETGRARLLHYLWEDEHKAELAVDLPNDRLEQSDDVWRFYGRIMHDLDDIEALVGHRKGYSVVLATHQPQILKEPETRKEAA